MTLVAVLVAGALGAVLRYLTSRVAARRPGFPWAVLIVNVVGSAIAGAVVALATDAGLSTDLRLILVTGFCGGLTTFSTFSVDTIQLLLDGRGRTAALSVAANLGLGVGAAALAWAIVATVAG